MTAKIVLGTVQFGLKYGVNNKIGKPSYSNVFNILNAAHELGISVLDTADGYGDACEVIGEFQKKFGTKFDIISKFTMEECNQNINQCFERSISRTHSSSFFGYLFHRFDDFIQFSNFNELERLRANGMVKYFGVSIYGLEELRVAVRHPFIDIIQVPFNIFDSSSEKESLLEEAGNTGKKIHVRSVFLQGLFYMNPNELPKGMTGFSKNLKDFHDILAKYKLGVEEVCLGYVSSFPFIDSIVLGVESIEQLNKNLKALSSLIPYEVIKEIKSIRLTNEEIIDPSKWKTI